MKEKLNQLNPSNQAEPNFGSVDSDLNQNLLLKNKPSNEEMEEISENIVEDPMDFQMKGKFYMLNMSQMPFMSKGVKCSPDLKPEQQ